MRVVALVLGAAFTGWIVLREFVLARIRARAVVLPEVRLALLLTGAGVLTWGIWPDRGRWLAVAGLALALACVSSGIWALFGCSRAVILQQAELVGRGLLMKPVVSPRTVEFGFERVRVAVIASGIGAALIRVHTRRGLKKGVLFRRGFRKFLGSHRNRGEHSDKRS